MAFRWAVNIGGWHPGEAELACLLTLLPETEKENVRSFKFLDDQKRALCSRLLQRQCTCQALQLKWQDVILKRTRGRKPFAAVQGNRAACPNFNFNVSHEVGKAAFCSRHTGIPKLRQTACLDHIPALKVSQSFTEF